MLVVHFGSGTKAIDQIIANSIGNYRLYESVLRELDVPGGGTLALSVYGARGGTSLGDLLRGPGARWPRFGTSTAATITEAGFDLWPTSLVSDGEAVPYSEHHFDIPIPGCDSKTADGYRSLPSRERRDVRDRFRQPFAELLALFEPRQLSELVAGST